MGERQPSGKRQARLHDKRVEQVGRDPGIGVGTGVRTTTPGPDWEVQVPIQAVHTLHHTTIQVHYVLKGSVC